MQTIDLLTQRLEQLTNEFNFLIKENKELKNQIRIIQDQNDIYTKSTQDFTLAITNMLKKENKS